jgi:hypothetical protein
MHCLLCQSDSTQFIAGTFLCPECALVFKNPDSFLDTDEDEKRYSQHQNNSEDEGYRNFLGKVTNPLKEFLPPSFNGLDYGCGPGPTMSLLLEDMGGEMENYDPIFFPDAHLLIPESYDVVTCTEVVEHFKNPKPDWDQLVSLVKDEGLLAVMTQFFTPETDYNQWWYKNDPTHVVFYQEKTLNYLSEKYQLDILYNDYKSVVIFKKRSE